MAHENASNGRSWLPTLTRGDLAEWADYEASNLRASEAYADRECQLVSNERVCDCGAVLPTPAGLTAHRQLDCVAAA